MFAVGTYVFQISKIIASKNELLPSLAKHVVHKHYSNLHSMDLDIHRRMGLSSGLSLPAPTTLASSERLSKQQRCSKFAILSEIQHSQRNSICPSTFIAIAQNPSKAFR